MAFWNDPSNLLLKQSHRWVISLPKVSENEGKIQNYSLPLIFVKSIDRPSVNMKTVQAKYLYAHTFNFPTRYNWNPIKITFYDVVLKDKKIYYAPNKDYSYIFFKEPIINPASSRKIGEGNSEKKDYKYHIESTQYFFQMLLQQAGYVVPNEFDASDNLLRFRDYYFKESLTAVTSGHFPQDGRYENNYIIVKEIDDSGKTIEEWHLYNPIITEVAPSRLDYSSDEALTITIGLSYDWAQFWPTAYDDAAEKNKEVQKALEPVKGLKPLDDPKIKNPFNGRTNPFNRQKAEPDGFRPPKVDAPRIDFGNLGSGKSNGGDVTIPGIGPATNTPSSDNKPPTINNDGDESSDGGDASDEEIAKITGTEPDTSGRGSVIPRTATITLGPTDYDNAIRQILFYEGEIKKLERLGGVWNKQELIESYRSKIQQIRNEIE